MRSRYSNLQIIKHALQYYITRPNANEKDLVREKNLLKQVEEEVPLLKEFAKDCSEAKTLFKRAGIKKSKINRNSYTIKFY